MILHKGEIIEKAVRNCRFSVTLLAQKMGKSRQHIYNIFQNRDVSIDIILQIGKIIHYDFTNDLTEMSKIPIDYKISVVSEPITNYETQEYWKSKYFELVEQHKLLLQKEFKAYFEQINP